MCNRLKDWEYFHYQPITDGAKYESVQDLSLNHL